MKNRIVTVLVIFGALLLPGGGCGVHIGNGANTYESKYGFAMPVSEKLSVTETNGGLSVSIDNGKLLTKASDLIEKISYVRLSVSQERVTSEQDILAMVERDHHNKYETKEMPGGVFAAISKKGSRSEYLSGKYLFFIRSKKQLVTGTMSAYPVGQGMELIAPILDGFRGR